MYIELNQATLCSTSAQDVAPAEAKVAHDAVAAAAAAAKAEATARERACGQLRAAMAGHEAGAQAARVAATNLSSRAKELADLAATMDARAGAGSPEPPAVGGPWTLLE